MLRGVALAKRGHCAEAEAVIATLSTLGSQRFNFCGRSPSVFCGEWYRAGIAAALGDDTRAVSLLPPNFGTTGMRIGTWSARCYSTTRRFWS